MERSVKADGLSLCAEDFGDPDDPPMILVMGAMASMLWWPEDFCRALAGRDFRVIRYDHRDTGRSTTYGQGKAPYAIADLAEDIFRVMDGFGAAAAHLVGFSMGGYLAQAAAIARPERVLSYVCWGAGALVPDPDLPGMDPELLDFIVSAMPSDWTDEAAVVAYHVEGQRRMAGTGHPFDEAHETGLARAEFARSVDRASAVNHAGYDTDHPGGAERITAPSLIIHGEQDRVTPPAHGRELAGRIPRARLLMLDGVGHDLPRAIWPAVIDAIAGNARRAA